MILQAGYFQAKAVQLQVGTLGKDGKYYLPHQLDIGLPRGNVADANPHPRRQQRAVSPDAVDVILWRYSLQDRHYYHAVGYGRTDHFVALDGERYVRVHVESGPGKHCRR